MAAKLPDASKYPIHISISTDSLTSSNYLCRDAKAYTPPPVRMMDNDKWHQGRPLCPECRIEHIKRFGEEPKWPKQ